MPVLENNLHGPCQQSVSPDDLVCHCLQIRASDICQARDVQGADSVEKVLTLTGAGTCCGSCHFRIRRVLLGLPAQCGPCGLCSGCGWIRKLCNCQNKRPVIVA